MLQHLMQDPRFTRLIDRNTGEVGRVVSSEKEPSGAHQFYFWAADDALTLDVGHIVVAFAEESAIIGVIDEPRRFSDLRTFLDDYFDRHVELSVAEETATQRPEILVFTVQVLATLHTRDDVDSKRPAVNGPVYFATREAIEYALNVENFSGIPVPALMHTNGNYERTPTGDIQHDENGQPRFQRSPIFLDADYLLGPEAGHGNWTGQSGLATKTSHVIFLLSSIFQTLRKQPKPDGTPTTVAALMFNVKGPDLVWLDKPAQPAPGLEAAYQDAGGRALSPDNLDAYAAMGLLPEAFENFRVFAPFRPGMTPEPHGGLVQLGGFRDHVHLNTSRTQAGETLNVFPVLWSLEEALWYPHRLFEGGDLDDKLFGFVFEIRERGVKSLRQLFQLFDQIRDETNTPDERGRKPETWNGHHVATIRKAENRFKGLASKLGGLLADGEVDYGHFPQVAQKFSPNEVRVVDIAHCNTNVQELLVTSVINRIWSYAEQSAMGVDKLIVFVDELNKYAPNGGEGGLRDTLVDIAARGRHLNLVLLGAEQFRSKVDSEILGNSGTSFYGRIGDEEIINSAYRSISETTKSELLGLKKGRLLVRHAHFRAPLFGTFPMPPTAAGVVGQRVFGSERVMNPAEAVHSTLVGLMGQRAPQKSEVLSVCEGLDPDELDKVVRRLMTSSNRSAHANPWESAKRMLNDIRQSAGVL